MPGDPSLYVLFQVCPVGSWPALAVLTALVWLGPGGPFAAVLAAGVAAAVVEVVSAFVQLVIVCAVVVILAALLLVLVLVTLAWMRDD